LDFIFFGIVIILCPVRSGGGYGGGGEGGGCGGIMEGKGWGGDPSVTCGG